MGDRRAKIIGRRPLTAAVTELTLEIAGEPFQWRAGQYLALALLSQPDQRHHYSIASAPDLERPAELTLAIANESGAEVLSAAVPGGELEVFGPFGEFGWRSASGAVFVGAGTGIVPLRALVMSALGSKFQGPLWLLAGSRTREDLLWREELEELGRTHPAFSYVPVLSRPDPEWLGLRGYVQEHVAEIGRRLPARSQVYLCGSTQMVGDCRGLLETLGVARDDIQSEAYS